MGIWCTRSLLSDEGGKGKLTMMATVATDLQQLGNALSGDILAWGTAVIGIALTASAVMWVFRLLRF